MDIHGKRIVLTGAASGIGRCLLEQLAIYDAQIVAADRHPVQPIAGSKATIHAYACDVSQQAQVDVLFAFAQDVMGGIDVFIANAGFAYYELMQQADWERMQAIFAVNVLSPFYATVKMRELHPEEPYTVVLLASAMAKLALPGYAVYGGTKAAIDRFSQSYRFEIPSNGHLMVVYPIATRTAFFRTANHGTPVPFPSQTADHVAKRIIDGLKRDAKTVFPSRLFWVGWHFLPFWRGIYQRIEARRFRRWLKHLPRS